jgi:TRAP-type mannitol/chloroaromatic compound transport system permease small subunit
VLDESLTTLDTSDNEFEELTATLSLALLVFVTLLASAANAVSNETHTANASNVIKTNEYSLLDLIFLPP